VDRLKGKRAIVTGAGSGIGRATAIRFATEGAAVLVVGRTQKNIDETVLIISEQGGIADAFVADVTKEDDVKKSVDYCVEKLGGLEIFFANAGNTDSFVPFLEQTVDVWEGQFRDNVISAFLGVKYAGRHMKDEGYGSIILNSSTGSLRANGGTVAYSACKAAINNLTMNAANAFSGTQIRVNAVLPGLCETKLTASTFELARKRGSESKMGQLTTLKRTGRVEEIAAVVTFLASDDSSYVDGQLIAVDGGISSTHPYGRFA